MSKNKEALGQGIRALLKSIDEEAAQKRQHSNYETSGAVIQIPLSQIEVNPFQPRTEFEEAALHDLAESIRAYGVVQPITVRKVGDQKFQLIAGERRLRASSIAKLDVIPAFVRTANDQESLEIALIENIQREDLNALEIAINYQRLIDECELTHEELSKHLGKSRTAITNHLRLLKLPPDIQAALKGKEISMGHARALVSVEHVDIQLEIFKKIRNKNLSVRQTEELVRSVQANGNKKVKKHTHSHLPYSFQKIQDTLSSNLSTRVTLKTKKKGGGEIVIYYHSDEDLERIVDSIGQ